MHLINGVWRPGKKAAPAGGGGGGGGGTRLASANFDDGTLGDFYNPWAGVGGVIDIIDDPTGAGRGKIARYHYINNPAGGNYDSNIGLYPVADLSFGVGAERWVQGDVYIPTPPAGTEFQNRKLIVNYGAPSGTDGALIIGWNQGTNPSVDSLVFGFGGGGGKAPIYQVYGIIDFSWNSWHTIKARYTVETTPGGTDGSLALYFDGSIVYSYSGIQFLTTDSSIGGPGFGYQYNSSIATNEYRYWDKISFATTEAALL